MTSFAMETFVQQQDDGTWRVVKDVSVRCAKRDMAVLVAHEGAIITNGDLFHDMDGNKRMRFKLENLHGQTEPILPPVPEDLTVLVHGVGVYQLIYNIPIEQLEAFVRAAEKSIDHVQNEQGLPKGSITVEFAEGMDVNAHSLDGNHN